jgi:hypothetical protein
VGGGGGAVLCCCDECDWRGWASGEEEGLVEEWGGPSATEAAIASATASSSACEYTDQTGIVVVKNFLWENKRKDYETIKGMCQYITQKRY